MSDGSTAWWWPIAFTAAVVYGSANIWNKGEDVTIYLAACKTPNIPFYECRTKGKGEFYQYGHLQFKIDYQKQMVFSLSALETTAYTKCVVSDKDNWKCTYVDGSGSFGISQGTYSSWVRDASLRDIDARQGQVSWWYYRYLQVFGK